MQLKLNLRRRLQRMRLLVKVNSHCISFLLSLPLIITSGCGSSDDSPSVVLYASADEYVVREVVAAFEQDTGISVLVVGDTEAKKTTGLVERLRAEADNPQADVFWSSEVFMTIPLAEEGVLAPFHSETADDWPEQFKDDEQRWFGFAARARVIVYAPDRVPEELRPVSWMNLTDDRFRRRIVMADPRFGTTGGHLGAMLAYWNRAAGPGYYEAFLLGLAENEIRMLPSGNAGVVRAVASGEADIGLTDTDDVWAAQAQDANIDLVYAVHSTIDGATDVGTLLIPNTVALVSGGPNEAAAAQLIDYLLSEKVERMLADSVSHNIPLRPGMAEQYPALLVPDPLRVNYTQAADLRTQAVSLAMQYLGEEKSVEDDS